MLGHWPGDVNAQRVKLGPTLLLSMGLALGAVHVEDDAVWWPRAMHPVDPGSGEIRERCEIRLACQPLGLEAVHLAGRGRQPTMARIAGSRASRSASFTSS